MQNLKKEKIMNCKLFRSIPSCKCSLPFLGKVNLSFVDDDYRKQRRSNTPTAVILNKVKMKYHLWNDKICQGVSYLLSAEGWQVSMWCHCIVNLEVWIDMLTVKWQKMSYHLLLLVSWKVASVKLQAKDLSKGKLRVVVLKWLMELSQAVEQ